MSAISLLTASMLTQKSERTLWRWITDGKVSRGADDTRGRTMVDVESLAPYLVVRLKGDELALLAEADDGVAEAQSDVALILMERGYQMQALYLLDMAAKQNYPDAMHWLGRCHLEGKGVPLDATLGLSWITRAAAAGHEISQEMTRRLVSDAITRTRC